MSYEGYVQCLCEDGHYFEVDAHDRFDECDNCFFCEKKVVWTNNVDETNGNADGHIDMDQFIQLTEVVEKCESCGHRNIKELAKYSIPTKEETEIFIRRY